jgi:negative regulator of flagellin synthesis FlgM
MVESIKNAVSRMETRKVDNTSAAKPDRLQGLKSAWMTSDTVSLQSTDNQSVVKEMASTAPIDLENVNRIKEAIKRGDYPIDIDRITDALMEAYREMKD